jgi:hypothetical protein
MRSIENLRDCLMNPELPAELLSQLAVVEDASIRRPLAGNPSTPVELLIEWSSDSDDIVRGLVAGNRSTPMEVLSVLASDKSNYVRTKAEESIESMNRSIAYGY